MRSLAAVLIRRMTLSRANHVDHVVQQYSNHNPTQSGPNGIQDRVATLLVVLQQEHFDS